MGDYLHSDAGAGGEHAPPTNVLLMAVVVPDAEGTDPVMVALEFVTMLNEVRASNGGGAARLRLDGMFPAKWQSARAAKAIADQFGRSTDA